MKKHLPKYVTALIKRFPKILSGRKNFIKHHERIEKNLNLTKIYKKN